MNNLSKYTKQSGFTPLITLLALGVLIALLMGFLWWSQNNSIKKTSSPAATTNPGPSVDPAVVYGPKQQMYDQNKDKIKSDLNLTEYQFQILKKYSAD